MSGSAYSSQANHVIITHKQGSEEYLLGKGLSKILNLAGHKTLHICKTINHSFSPEYDYYLIDADADEGYIDIVNNATNFWFIGATKSLYKKIKKCKEESVRSRPQTECRAFFLSSAKLIMQNKIIKDPNLVYIFSNHAEMVYFVQNRYQPQIYSNMLYWPFFNNLTSLESVEDKKYIVFPLFSNLWYKYRIEELELMQMLTTSPISELEYVLLAPNEEFYNKDSYMAKFIENMKKNKYVKVVVCTTTKDVLEVFENSLVTIILCHVEGTLQEYYLAMLHHSFLFCLSHPCNDPITKLYPYKLLIPTKCVADLSFAPVWSKHDIINFIRSKSARHKVIKELQKHNLQFFDIISPLEKLWSDQLATQKFLDVGT
jgi:hypothetical protein